MNRNIRLIRYANDADTVEFNDLVFDARGKGHWGTGDVEVSLKTMGGSRESETAPGALLHGELGLFQSPRSA